MNVTHSNGRFIASTTFDERLIPKTAGFRWNPTDRHWYTTDPLVALKLERFADEPARAAIAAASAGRREALAASSAVSLAASAAEALGALPRPEGLAYRPFQEAGIAYAIQRDGTLIGDEPGLGKTIQAAGVANLMLTRRAKDGQPASPFRMLVICPASLRLNWRNELNLWLVAPLPVHVIEGTKRSSSWEAVLERGGVVVINYDVLKNHKVALDAGQWDLLVIDEAHMLKSPKSLRTKAALGYRPTRKELEQGVRPEPAIPAARRVFLTGTPILNKPLELWPLVHSLAPQEFPNFFTFATRYCDGKRTRYGWDFTGSSNLDELQVKLRTTCMVRRLKADVLKELPAKQRQVIELPVDKADTAKIINAEAKEWMQAQQEIDQLRAEVELARLVSRETYAEAVKQLQRRTAVAFNDMSKTRQKVAVAKTPQVVEHITELLEAERKVVVFCHHIEVARLLMDGLRDFNPVSLVGGMSSVDRQAAVDRFQKDPSCRVFVGSIYAAGVGHTLTAARVVVMAELDWVPGIVTQAEDRCHRIGQDDTVLIQHLVLEGSLDTNLARALVRKQAVADAAMDDFVDPDSFSDDAKAEALAQLIAEAEEAKRQRAEREAARAAANKQGDRRTADFGSGWTVEAKVEAKVEQRTATSGLTPEIVAKLAAQMTPAQVNAVHTALKTLADQDWDRAQLKNDVGFNKADGYLGKLLAVMAKLDPSYAVVGRMLVKKYGRQLGQELIEAMG